jgi:N-acyl-phosphatidylethanolamine-hydrolysing phospholipase D
MHWGTFILTDEPIKEPREILARVLSERGLPIDFFTAPKPGEILELQ